jgi:hypothetical protein
MTVEDLIEELQTLPTNLEVRCITGEEVTGISDGLYFDEDDYLIPADEYDGEDVDDAQRCVIIDI